MSVSDRDRTKMGRLSEALARVETNDEPSPERRAEILAWADASRARSGIPPLADEWANPPEAEFYRKARALGMARVRRSR